MINKKLFLTGIDYPDELLEHRIQIEGNVVACIWKDVFLLDEYNLTKEHFITKDGRFLFSLAKDLRDKHLNVLDEVSVLSNSNQNVIERFNALGGYEAIENLTSIINLDNWEMYSDLLYRENLLCELHDDGFNLFKEISYQDKKIIPIKVFRKMTSEQVVDFYEVLFAGYDIGQSSNIVEEGIVYFEDDWIDNRETEKRLGTSIATAGFDINGEEINCFPFLSNQTLGLFHGKTMMVGGFSSAGKSTYFVSIIMALLSQGEKVLIICNEEEMEKFKTKIMVWLLAKYCRYYKLTKNKLDSGNITDEDKEQMRKAVNYFNSNYGKCLTFVGIDTTDISIIKKKIREYALKYGYSAFLVDTFKISENDISNTRQDLSLVRDSRELLRLARKYNMIGMASVQLAEHMKGTLSLTANALSNSKQIKEVLELLLMMRAAYDEELDSKNKFYCHPFQRKRVNGVWIEEPYQVDRTASYRILSVEKNRNGQDTGGNGESYLLRFDGSHSVFREVAYCRTRHGQIV